MLKCAESLRLFKNVFLFLTLLQMKNCSLALTVRLLLALKHYKIQFRITI